MPGASAIALAYLLPLSMMWFLPQLLRAHAPKAQLRQQFLRHLAETGFADAEAGEDGGDQVNVHRYNLSLVQLG